jgi:autotransporter-associated beta strand protein
LGQGSYAGTIANSGTFQYSSSAAQSLSGVINGTGALVKDTGSSVLTISGNTANTYSGLTTVSAGRLDLNKTAGVNAIVGDGVASKITPDVLINGGELRLLANNQLDDSVFINMTSGVFNVNGKTETIYWFTNSGGAYIAPRGSALTVIDPTWSGGSNDIVGTDSYGNLIISGGANTIHGDEASGFGSGSVTVGAGGLEFTGATNTNLTLSSDDVAAGRLILNGNVSFTGTAGTASITNGNKLIDQSGGAGTGPWTDTGLPGTFAGTGDMGGATRTYTIADGTAANDMLISAVITNGALTKTGAGTLALSGANTYAGATLISAGNLQLGNGGTTGALSPSSTITNNGTLTFNRSNAMVQGTDFAAGISGTGNVTQSGTGTTTLSGTNSYGGATTVNAGTLEVIGALSGTTSTQINSGGTLLLNNNANNIVNTAVVANVAGGTLAVGNLVTGKNQNLASLTLSGASILDFGSGAAGNQMTFGSSGGFTGTLAIWNWTGSLYSSLDSDTGTLGDGQDRFVFNTTTGWSGGQLGSIQFYSDAGVTQVGFGAAEIGFGGQFEIVPVPEPATTALIGAVALCALIGYRERRFAVTRGLRKGKGGVYVRPHS